MMEKEKEELININQLDSIEIGGGSRLVHTFTLHESVGYNASYEISDEDVVELIEKRYTYRHPERMKDPQITGADEALGEFIFLARSTGRAVISIYFEFRFEIERSHQVEVIVQ